MVFNIVFPKSLVPSLGVLLRQKPDDWHHRWDRAPLHVGINKSIFIFTTTALFSTMFYEWQLNFNTDEHFMPLLTHRQSTQLFREWADKKYGQILPIVLLLNIMIIMRYHFTDRSRSCKQHFKEVWESAESVSSAVDYKTLLGYIRHLDTFICRLWIWTNANEEYAYL